ncbi:MAG: M20/M25/M40 family metallo-hydrolase [Bradyrhizobiaceae bacterium]|nr:M20/M25/M40 family metallo-hydrolase [Bradyrhizobiaceae bacterium]
MTSFRVPFRRTALAALCLAIAAPAAAAPDESVRTLAAKQKAPLIDTLKDLVGIESGSGDREGLDRIAEVVAARLRALGGAIETIEPDPADIYPMADTPKQIGKMVQARFTGSGTKKILLIAHMDTVYLRGMLAQQPFRIDGNRAYGLGIADDKNGIAVILHTLSILREMNFRDYGVLTVLINADEEVSSPGSRATLTRLGSAHDAVFSCEGSRVESDQLSLTTAGIAAVALHVRGKASHAGAAPEKGRNALYEMAHQILQTRDLSDPEIGVKMNWTLARAGTNRNVIPADATAMADVRVLRVADYDGIEQKVRERIKKQLISDTTVEMTFERRRPPLEVTPAARALAAHAQGVYAEIGDKLIVRDVAEGGGTDAAFAALRTTAPVIERFGLRGFGSHSNDAEYVDLDSVEPRLYLLTRMIMDVSQGKAD